MSSDLSSKLQNALWWITSIATSVVCCSVIFVLFASYLVDVRQDIKEGNMRINAIEEREDKILAELEAIRKHGTAQPPLGAEAAPAVEITSPATPVAPSVSSPLPAESAPASTQAPVEPAAAPASLVPVVPPAASAPPAAPSLPAVAPPAMTPAVPSATPAPEKK